MAVQPHRGYRTLNEDGDDDEYIHIILSLYSLCYN